jgi:superfamily II DNA helicase RecQ
LNKTKDDKDDAEAETGTGAVAKPKVNLDVMKQSAGDVKMFLNVVKEFDDRVGLNKLINIIRGSKAKDITDYMKESPFYGKGSKQPLEWWKNLGQQLLNDEYIKERPIMGSFGSTIFITKKGLTQLKPTLAPIQLPSM